MLFDILCQLIYNLGMKGQITRNRLVDTAAALFEARGYNGVGIAELIEASGTPRGSFYFHFPKGKLSLAEAVIDKSRTDVLDLIDRASGSTEGTSGFLRALGRDLQKWLIITDFRGGCPIAGMTIELSASSHVVQQNCKTAYDEWIAAIRQVLQDNGTDTKRASRLALVIVSSLEGAVVLSRAQRTTAPLKNCVRFLVDCITDGRG